MADFVPVASVPVVRNLVNPTIEAGVMSTVPDPIGTEVLNSSSSTTDIVMTTNSFSSSTNIVMTINSSSSDIVMTTSSSSSTDTVMATSSSSSTEIVMATSSSPGNLVRNDQEAMSSDVASGECDEPDESVLYKPKTKRKKSLIAVNDNTLVTERVSFKDFANTLLNDHAFLARITESKRRASKEGLPALRRALDWNTRERIRGIMLGLYKNNLPSSLNKTPLISAFIEHVESCVPRKFPPHMTNSVADIGIVHTTDDFLVKGEIVYLRANATNNSQELCVNLCENFGGWVFRNGDFVEWDWINRKHIHYGRLVEKRKKDYTIIA